MSESLLLQIETSAAKDYLLLSMFTVPCGGPVTASLSYQYLTSPGYPSNYQNNAYCSWAVTAPTGYVITIEITAMDIESNYDFLTIYQGIYISSGILQFYPRDSTPRHCALGYYTAWMLWFILAVRQVITSAVTR